MKDNRTQLQTFYRFMTVYASIEGHLDLLLFKFQCGYKKNSKETTKIQFKLVRKRCRSRKAKFCPQNMLDCACFDHKKCGM